MTGKVFNIANQNTSGTYGHNVLLGSIGTNVPHWLCASVTDSLQQSPQ